MIWEFLKITRHKSGLIRPLRSYFIVWKTFLCVDKCLDGAKEGDRERVRERENEMESVREHQRPSNRGRVGLTI